MERGPADEAVVIVKLGAEEPVVTWGRVNHRVSGREAGGEGVEPVSGQQDWLKTMGLRSARQGVLEYPRRSSWRDRGARIVERLMQDRSVKGVAMTD
jgi:hypothetical protein